VRAAAKGLAGQAGILGAVRIAEEVVFASAEPSPPASPRGLQLVESQVPGAAALGQVLPAAGE